MNNVNTDRDLTCFYQNVRSLKASGKLSQFQNIVLTNHFDIIALTETWLNDSVTNHEILPDSYTIYRKDGDFGKRGGGVLLAVKDNIPVETFHITILGLELISVFIKTMNKNILVSVCYRPPDAGPEFIQQLNEFRKYLSDKKIKDLTLIGDFNFPFINWLDGLGFSDISSDINFIDSINEAGILQMITSHTRCQNMIDFTICQ